MQFETRAVPRKAMPMPTRFERKTRAATAARPARRASDTRSSTHPDHQPETRSNSSRGHPFGAFSPVGAVRVCVGVSATALPYPMWPALGWQVDKLSFAVRPLGYPHGRRPRTEIHRSPLRQRASNPAESPRRAPSTLPFATSFVETWFTPNDTHSWLPDTGAALARSTMTLAVAQPSANTPSHSQNDGELLHERAGYLNESSPTPTGLPASADPAPRLRSRAPAVPCAP